jgi:hypothetical protein
MIQTVFDQSGDDDGRGLGDFWSCIDREYSVTIQAFHEKFHDYQVVGQLEFAPSGGEDVDSAVRMELHTDLVDAVAWVGGTDRGFMLVSHYPTVLRECGEVEATVLAATSWEPHWEGVIEVAAAGKTFSVFDVLFPSARDGYRESESIRLSLCGLASSVHRMSRVAEHLSGPSLSADVMTQVYETGVCWFGHSNRPEHPKDFHVLFGKLLHVASGSIGPSEIYRTKVELFPGVIVPIVFGTTSLEEDGWTPLEGDFVAMMVFLHGYRTALRASGVDWESAQDGPVTDR